jgi:hypothetical protein
VAAVEMVNISKESRAFVQFGMNPWIIAGALIIASCERKSENCPYLEKFLKNDPEMLARAALIRGDRRPMAIMGYGPTIVGRDNGVRPVIIVKETVENVGCGCINAQREVMYFIKNKMT